MSSIAQTLAPLILLIGLGAALARIRFLGPDFIADLNKLAFWIALPALVFRSAAHATHAGEQTWLLLGVMLAATMVVLALGWVLTMVLGVPGPVRGTFIQSGFRANLAFIGIPLLASSVALVPEADRVELLTTAVIVMTIVTSSYNILAVVVLQASRSGTARGEVRTMVESIATNPLLLSGLSGLAVGLLGIPMAGFLDRTLETLGDAAVPIALLCIGGSLTAVRFTGRRSWVVAAALLKVVVAPAVVAVLAGLARLNPVEQRIALVFAASPTAAAAYVMARQMGGDTALASGSIALSTLLSAISLAVALWLTPL